MGDAENMDFLRALGRRDLPPVVCGGCGKPLRTDRYNQWIHVEPEIKYFPCLCEPNRMDKRAHPS
jgi:hypothetical protein